MPEAFCSPYKLGEYDADRIQNVMWKYLNRQYNCERAWVRINHHFPETLTAEEPLDILEFSTAHGAMLEIWRHFGHRVVGTDYAWTTSKDARVKHKGVRKPWHEKLLQDVRAEKHGHRVKRKVKGWPYQPIIESLDLDVRLFDGGERPYPFADNSFDVVCCFQAIEAYSDPEHWIDTIREFCRISRKSVVVGFNPLPVDSVENREIIMRARKAWVELQRFNENGFQTVFFEIGQTRRGIHPTVCKLVAS